MRLLISIVVLICTVIGVQTVRGFNAWTYGGTVLVWPGNQLVRYLYPSSFSEGTEPFDLILYSMSEWNNIDGSSFVFSLESISNGGVSALLKISSSFTSTSTSPVGSFGFIVSSLR